MKFLVLLDVEIRLMNNISEIYVIRGEEIITFETYVQNHAHMYTIKRLKIRFILHNGSRHAIIKTKITRVEWGYRKTLFSTY